MTNDSVSELELLMTPIKDTEHLQLWLHHFIGITLPDCAVTKYSDSTPLAFVWRIYQAGMQGDKLHIMALAGRDSSKTVALSIAELLLMLHDQRGAIHLGMTKAQATRAKDYIDGYVNRIPLLRAAIVKQNTTELKLKISGEEVGLELLAMSPKAVQGAHKAMVSYDELASSVDPTHMKAYKDSSGIPGSSPKGKPAIIAKITSRQAGYSLAEQEIKNQAKSGIQIVKWTTIDTMKKCPDSRSGTQDLPLWINIIKGEKYTDEEFEGVAEGKRDGFERVTTTKTNCYSCPLAMYCQGNARNQTSDSVLLRSIDDVIQKVNASGSHEWVLSQIMSLEASKEGLVYFEFNRMIHIPGWDEMWKRLTGEESAVPVTREMFTAKAIKQGSQFYAGVDWGWSSPSTCVVVCIDSRDNIYVLEAMGRTYSQPGDFIQLILDNICKRYPIDMFMPDSEDQAALQQMRDKDMPVAKIDKSAGTVKAGITTVKRFLKIPGTNNSTKILIAPDIISTIPDVPGIVDEFDLYRKKTDVTGKIRDDDGPEKGNDHYLDAFRYILFYLFGKDIMKAMFADPASQGNTTAIPGMPMDQIAMAAGVKFVDNRHEFNQMGAQGDPRPSRKKPDDDPDGNGPGSGGGGFTVNWT